MATYNFFSTSDEEDIVDSPSLIMDKDDTSIDPVTIEDEDSDEDKPRFKPLRKNAHRSHTFKRSSSSIASDVVLSNEGFSTPYPRSTTSSKPPTKKARRPPDAPELVEVKAKLRKTQQEKNVENKRIANDKTVKALKGELEQKDQALVCMAVDRNQMLEKVKKLETASGHLRRRQNFLTRENERLRQDQEADAHDFCEKEHLKMELEAAQPRIKELEAQVQVLETELKKLREYKATIVAASAS